MNKKRDYHTKPQVDYRKAIQDTWDRGAKFHDMRKKALRDMELGIGQEHNLLARIPIIKGED